MILIKLVLNLAKLLLISLIVIGLLEFASLVPLLNGTMLSLMLAVIQGYAAGIVIAICVLSLYYVSNYVIRQLKRYNERAKKAGK